MLCRHASELAEAEGAAVGLEALHHEVVVERLHAAVRRAPRRLAPRAVDLGLEAALVAARDGRFGSRLGGRGGLRRRLGRGKDLEGAHERLEGLGRLLVARQLVGVDHPSDVEVDLALLCEGRAAADRLPEQRQHALGVATFGELQHLLCQARRQRLGVLALRRRATRRATGLVQAGFASATLGAALLLERVEEPLHQLVARLDRQVARQASLCQQLAKFCRLERSGVPSIRKLVLLAGLE